jgi:tRNA wybutosine-synthesizing protein 5
VAIINHSVVKVIDLVPGSVKDLPVIDHTMLEADVFWREHVCKHRPVIIKGGATHWPAIRKWGQPGYLEATAPTQEVMYGTTFNCEPPPVLGKSMQIKSVADGLRDMRLASDVSTCSMPAISVPPEWQDDLGQYNFLPDRLAKKPRAYGKMRIFVYKNASTEWHYHPIDETLTTQLAGTKRISFFRLTAKNWIDYQPVLAANLHHLDCGRHFFPKNGSLVKYEGTLEPGDVAYLPPFWWHGIDPMDSSIGATLAYCFRTPWHRFGHWKDPATRALMSRKRKSVYSAPALMARLALSGLARQLRGERWHEEI